MTFRRLSILALVWVLASAVAPEASATTAPASKPLPVVVINNVTFEAVEYETKPLPWRNLAVTVVTEQLQAWRAFPASRKTAFAQTLIDLYRAGMKYNGNIKLSFIDDRNDVLDQYLWSPVDLPVKNALKRGSS